MITASITRPSGVEVYRDTIYINNWKTNSKRDTTFRDFPIDTVGRFDLTIILHLPTDEDRSNDTLRSYFQGVAGFDFQSVRVVEPPLNAIKPGKHTFPITALFKATMLSFDDYNVPVRVVIRACNNTHIEFQSDTSIAHLHPDSAATPVTFPNRQGTYDLRKLKPGCYGVSTYAVSVFDLDHSNDTATSSFTIIADTLGNDVAADSIIAPTNSAPWAIDDSVPISFRFKNTGSSDEVSANVSAVVEDSKGAFVFRDTVTLLDWKRNESRVVNFRSFVPDSGGVHSIFGITILLNDEFTLNDTLSRRIDVGYSNDVKSVAVIHPLASDTITTGTSFPLQATFKWVATDGIDASIPLRFLIRRCNGSLVYLADTVMDFLPFDRSDTLVSFPMQQGPYALTRLSPGCYQAYAIARQIGDQNHLNDTASSTFEILPAQSVASAKLGSDEILNVRNATPNPFASTFTIGYQLSESAQIILRLSDAAGRVIRYSEALQLPGDHSNTYDVHELRAGAYYLEVMAISTRGSVSSKTSPLVCVPHH